MITDIDLAVSFYSSNVSFLINGVLFIQLSSKLDYMKTGENSIYLICFINTFQIILLQVV